MAELTKKRKGASGDGTKAARARPGRTAPSILVTGTPGVGKTRAAEAIAARLGLERVGVSELAASLGAHEEWDEERKCHVLDEDAVLDAMEPRLGAGGCVVDYHACELFPERWFDLVLVLRARTEVLYDRLQARGYGEAKLRENMECEIMQVVLEEARASYAEGAVVELQNNAPADLEALLGRVAAWREAWGADNA
mmetsp:Transcript_28358/g.84906  ORF Transcript_28358/g.84906 Transcript_28358/m.84906 type:complete len:196 (-) Transcript_28358:68-655(-)